MQGALARAIVALSNVAQPRCTMARLRHQEVEADTLVMKSSQKSFQSRPMLSQRYYFGGLTIQDAAAACATQREDRHIQESAIQVMTMGQAGLLL